MEKSYLEHGVQSRFSLLDTLAITNSIFVRRKKVHIVFGSRCNSIEIHSSVMYRTMLIESRISVGKYTIVDLIFSTRTIIIVQYGRVM